MKPKVSIIIPVYKVEKYIRRCVDSVLRQTLQEIEIILIDDGSPDLCGEICEEYKTKDKRVRVLHEENMGVSAARNAGLKVATGEYIGFVDSDDCISDLMFETLYSQARNQDADICMCCFKCIDDSKEIVQFEFAQNEKCAKNLNQKEAFEVMTDFNKPVQTAVWNKIYRADVVEKIRFDEKKKMAEDLEFLMKSVIKSRLIVFVPDILYGYCVRREGAATSFNHELHWYLEQNKNITATMNMVADFSGEMRNLAISYKCVNGDLSIANFLVVKNERNKKVQSFIQSELKSNIVPVLRARMHIIKKIQIIVYIISPSLYRFVMKKKIWI